MEVLMATKMCILPGLVALAAVLLSIPDVAQAQDTMKRPALVGTWRVVFERPPGPPGLALVTFTSDGTSVRTTDRSPVMSASHGVWKQVGEGEFQATWNAFQFNDKGAHIGNQKASFVVRFGSDLDSFTGDGNGTNMTLDGTVTGKVVGPFKGTRVALEPYAGP
jgi:hypothetical protein